MSFIFLNSTPQLVVSMLALRFTSQAKRVGTYSDREYRNTTVEVFYLLLMEVYYLENLDSAFPYNIYVHYYDWPDDWIQAKQQIK